MNIVVKAGSASLTQFTSNTAYSLSDIKVYIMKDVSVDKVIFVADELTYPCTCAAVADAETLGDFILHDLTFDGSTLPENTYTIQIKFTNANILTITSPVHLKTMLNDYSSLDDEHNALLIVDRTIQVVANQVMLVAEDNLSQQIRFKIRKKYDNISFLNPEKKIVYIDYIPADWENVKEELINSAPSLPVEQQEALRNMTFIHSTVVIEETDNPEYCYIRWNVPYLATIKAGTLKIAISIENVDNQDQNDEAIYLWQTLPATLTVQPNIGIRKQKGNINVVTTDLIDARITAIEELFNEFTNTNSVITLVEGAGVNL